MEENSQRVYLMTSNQVKELAEQVAQYVISRLKIEHQEENMKAVSEKDLLSPNEACKMFHISKTTLWRLEKSGRLIPVRMSERTIRYKLSDIEELLSK